MFREKGQQQRASKFSEDFAEKKKEVLEEIRVTVEMEEIPPELVLNWDQTGIKLVPLTGWTMEEQDARRVELVGLNDKRKITAVFCGNILGAFLPIQVIYQAMSSTLQVSFTLGYNSLSQTLVYRGNYATVCTANYCSICRTDEGVLGRRQTSSCHYGGQITKRMTELMESHNIHTCPTLTASSQWMLQSTNQQKLFSSRSFKCGVQNRSQSSWKMRQVWRMQLLKQLICAWLE